MYVLRADLNSFDKPSEIYGDFEKILGWYKYQFKLLYQKATYFNNGGKNDIQKFIINL